MTQPLSHKLDRTITIRAHRDLVFRYFTDSARWAAWWGAGSAIDARVGGKVLIRFPGGTDVVGEVEALRPPESIVFSYGYKTSADAAPGASRVTITLHEVPEGTRLHLEHAFAEEGPMREHVQGWRYQLSLFSNLVANELHTGATATADRWFAMWSNPDASTRHRELDQLASSDVSMRDRFSAVYGLEDVRAHVDAVHRFMPGFALQREGDVQHCQGMLLVGWKARGPDGQPRGSGTNVFGLTADGRIESVTGFWTSP